MTREEIDLLLDRVASVLFCCFILTYVLLFLWLGLYVGVRDGLYRISARWFDVSMHDFMIVNCWGMAFAKVTAILFFFFPYVSIKVVRYWTRRK